MPGIMTFKTADVIPLLEHAKAAPAWAMGYEKGPAVPALFLVGDQGIYLMSNGQPRQLRPNSQTSVQAFPKECDPESMEFDDWYEAKGRIFGGDDGSETLKADWFDALLKPNAPATFKIKLTKNSIQILLPKEG